MTHWSVLGAGSLGSLWACYLSQQHSVSLITRKISSNAPLILQQNKKEHSFKIARETTAQLSKSIDHLVLCTKAYDALTALQSVSSHLTKKSKVLLLQNGMGSQQAIADTFPDIAIYAASCTEGAYKIHDHTVVHAGQGKTVYGPLTNAAKDQPLQLNCNLLVEFCPHIQPVLLQKLAINCAINGLTCIYSCKNGELLDGQIRQEHLETLCYEIQRVIGSALPPEVDIYKLACDVAKSTAQNISSMRQDILNQKATEIDFINGYLQQLADSKDIATPTNRQVIHEVKRLQKSY